jgi:hypothetical protein
LEFPENANSSFDIFDCFQGDRTSISQFLEIAERNLISLVNNPKERGKYRRISALGRIGKSEASIMALQQVITGDRGTYDEVDDAIVALGEIGNELAISALLDCLPRDTLVGGWIETQLSNLAYSGAISLDRIPYLWAIAYQSNQTNILNIIPIIQERSGKYNPDFTV